MLTYVLICLTWIATTGSLPIQTPNLKPTAPLVYYTPSSTSQYVSPQNLFMQYSGESPTFGKALQSIPSTNEFLFYPNTAPVLGPQSVLVNNAQHENVAAPTKFTAPPSGLVNAIYAWFAENNIPVPDDPSKNDASQDRIEIERDQGKIENPDKPPTAGEAEVLAEAEKNPNFHYPKKSATPKYIPGQRFYILNGQPQYFGNYQPLIPRLQPVVPQLFTRNAVPSDTQNILILQPHTALQHPSNLKFKTHQQAATHQQENAAQNILLVRNNLGGDQISTTNIQPEIIKPLRYHSQDLKPQNFVLVRESQPQNNQPQIQVQPFVQTYSRQQLLIGRLLPRTHEIKQQQITQNPIHQTHYVPVEVVPPQVPQRTAAHLQYHNEEIPQDTNSQHLSFIHIPVDRNVQPPQYIKSVIPIRINAKPQIPELPAIPLQNQQHSQAGQEILYLTPEVQQSINAEQQVQGTATSGIESQIQHQPQSVDQQQNIVQQPEKTQISNDVPPGIAALEFARYIASRHGDLYSDTVVIDAKTSDDQNEQESESDETQADVPEEPSLAQALPSGIAIAGPGGVAATAPRGTALVGENGLAIASPQATAVAGPNPEISNDKAT